MHRCFLSQNKWVFEVVQLVCSVLTKVEEHHQALPIRLKCYATVLVLGAIYIQLTTRYRCSKAQPGISEVLLKLDYHS